MEQTELPELGPDITFHDSGQLDLPEVLQASSHPLADGSDFADIIVHDSGQLVLPEVLQAYSHPLAHGSEHADIIFPANGGDLGHARSQQELPGEHHVETPQQRRARKRQKTHEREYDLSIPWTCLPYLRTSAIADLPRVAEIFGEDLLNVPEAWLDVSNAHQLIAACGVSLSIVVQWFLFEIFAGCAHLTQASVAVGLPTGPSIDVLPGDGNRYVANLLTPEGRQIVWAMLVVFCPMWVHLGFPCTFWSQLAHMTRRRDIDRNEQARLESLAFIAFSRQIVQWQVSRWQHVSIENPPRCRSWALDLTQDMVNMGQLRYVEFDGCAWGMVDPGNGLAYKKAMRIASTVDLSCLHRRCDKRHAHQKVEGCVGCGARKGTARSKISGEYPMSLCHAWVACMKAAVGA